MSRRTLLCSIKENSSLHSRVVIMLGSTLDSTVPNPSTLPSTVGWIWDGRPASVPVLLTGKDISFSCLSFLTVQSVFGSMLTDYCAKRLIERKRTCDAPKRKAMDTDATFVDLPRGRTTRTSWNELHSLPNQSSNKSLASENWKRCKRIRLLAYRLFFLNPSVRNLGHHPPQPVSLVVCVSPPKRWDCYLCTILRFSDILASNPRLSMATLSGKHTMSVRRSCQRLGWMKSMDRSSYLVLTLSRRIAGS